MSTQTKTEMEDALRALLLELADVFAAEGRPGADAVAAAYASAATGSLSFPPRQPYRLDTAIEAATRGARHPAAIAARAADAVLRWNPTANLEGIVPAEISKSFTAVHLIGPGAMIEAQGVSSGLFVQAAGEYYPLHAHSAEETYVMLAGEAEWALDDAPPKRRRSGDYVHHPSYAAHATRTGDQPILAAWRWSGDLRRETYRLLDDPAARPS